MVDNLSARVIKNRIVEIRRVRLGDVASNPRNWRLHPEEQKGAIRATLEEIGWAGVPLVYESERTGGLTFVDGHARKEVAPDLEADVAVLDLTDKEADALLLRYDPLSSMIETDNQALLALIDDAERSSSGGLNDLLKKMAEEASLALEELSLQLVEQPAHRKPNPRDLPLDVIYTTRGADSSCCLAVLAGLRYGFQSKGFSLCPYAVATTSGDRLGGRHRPFFIDNDFYDYDQKAHADVIREMRPKYATVRDVMTKEQCRAAGIDYFPLEQVLDWADELDGYAENIIVIPKYDCFDQIPERYVLGYSIPTSHGGTPLPPRSFAGRRVHLLGGSWKSQLSYLAELGEDVVSLDNNYVLKQCNWGMFVYPDGTPGNLTKDLGLPRLSIPRYVALAISFGSMGMALNDVYAGKVEEEEVSVG